MLDLTTRRFVLAGAAALAAPVIIRPARAAPAEVRIVQQIGLSYLPITVMRIRGLVEAEAKKRNLATAAVYSQVANGSSVNDALVSGNVDIGTVSIGPLLALWQRTITTLKVKGVAAVDASGVVLNTNQARLRSLADFGDQDRIAMPDVDVSYQALLLQMACEKEFGAGQAARLDRLTVSMPHPEAATMLLGGRSEITAHFATAPFLFQEAESGKVNRIVTSPEILGGPGTFVNLVCPQRVRDESRWVFEAVLAALGEAQRWITANPDDAAQLYIAAEHSKL